ncbi:MAG: DNA polymerase III subunit delta [Thermodesulfobacteriota bacterium]
MERNNKIFPVMLFQGSQSFLIDREIEEIRKVKSQTNPELNYLTFHLDTDPLVNVIETVNTVSMFGEQKLIIAKNSESLKSKDIAILNSYIEKPSPDTCLVLISRETNKPKLKKNSHLKTRNFNKIDMVESKIRNEAELLGINISRKACNELYRLIGDDFTLINNELIKISNYFGNKKLIDEKDIENFILKRKEEDIFNLINTISNRETKSAVRILKNLENEKYEPLSIVSTLSWRMRQIWQVKELQNMKKSDKEIAEMMKITSGAVYYIKKQSNKFSAKSLSEIISKLKTLDTELKSLSQDKYNLVNRFVLDTCNKE